MNEPQVVALISLLLYSSLALVAGRYYLKFVRLRITRSSHSSPQQSKVLYDGPKEWFFLVLTITALIDIPLPIGCLYEGGPQDCEWDNLSYPIGWYLHMIAIVGYAYTIMVPCILWNDIMTGGNGYLFPTSFTSCFSSLSLITTSSSHTTSPSPLKIFLRILMIGYIFNTVSDVISGIITFRVHNHSYYSTNIEYNISVIIEVILICCITIACFISGMRLHAFVIKQEQLLYPKQTTLASLPVTTSSAMGLGSIFATRKVEERPKAATTVKAHRIMLYLNLPMAVIMITYMIRGVFELRLVSWMPPAYIDTFRCSFIIWTFVAKWLPYGCCSFVLIWIMRMSGTERKMKAAQRPNISIASEAEYSVVSTDDMTRSLIDDQDDVF